MKSVVFNSAAAYLLDDAPDWVDAVELTAEIPSILTQGLSGLEDRRLQGDTLRLSLSYATLVQGAGVIALRNCLQALTVEPVLCPLWPALFQPGVTPRVAAAYYVLCGDGQDASIVAAAGLPFNRPACPLMIGRLTNAPKPEMVTGDWLAVKFEFQENAASYLTPAALALTNSLAAANGARPLFPYRANWDKPPVSGGSEQTIERRNIGHVRVTSDAYYTQISRRVARQDFTLETADAWGLLSFFLQMGGQRQNFWLPVSISEAALTEDVGALDTALQVDLPGALGGKAFVVLDDLAKRVACEVEGTSGNEWELSAAVGQAFVAAGTRIESLMLARFDSTSINLKFAGPVLAEASLSFKELPWEAAGASAETIGTTMGPLPTTASLYVFSIAYPGAAQVWRYTGFERNLVDGSGNSYASIGIERGDLTETATIERSSVTLKMRQFSGNPVGMMVPFALEWPLRLQIYEADVAGNLAGNLRCWFSGEVTECQPDGPFFDVTAASLSYVFDRQIPRRLYQPGCNWSVYEAKCGITRANWKYRGTVADVNMGATVHGWNPSTMSLSLSGVASQADPVNAAVLAAQSFAGGYLCTGAGNAVQYRMISLSTAPVAGALDVVLATAFTAVPAVGSYVYLFPGCDGTVTRCLWFGNYANFGGFPFIPATNPTNNIINPAMGGAGKK